MKDSQIVTKQKHLNSDKIYEIWLDEPYVLARQGSKSRTYPQNLTEGDFVI